MHLMGAGFAKICEKTFPARNIVLSQRREIGDVCYAKFGNITIAYLVTKQFSAYCKPTKEDFSKALEVFANYCKQNGVQTVVMPRIGCGLDRLSWKFVRQEIIKYFSDTPTNIIVYRFVK